MSSEVIEQQCLDLITEASKLRSEAQKCHCKTKRLELEEKADKLEKEAEQLLNGNNNEESNDR